METIDIKTIVSGLTELNATLKEVTPLIKELVEQDAAKPKQEDEDKLLTVDEVCDTLKIHKSTFYRNELGRILTPYKVGKSIKYKKSSIEKLRLKGW